MSILRWFLCHVLGDHDWTCAAKEGIPATQRQLNKGMAGFYSYATMYCKHCKTISKLSGRRL